jgi:hypothetical protein
MWFYLKRYRYVVSKNRKFLPLVLAPLAIYLVGAAAMADRLLVTQKIRLPQDTPIASAKGPVEVISVNDLISHPEDFFQDQFALAELANLLYAFPELGQGGPPANALRVVCQRDMSLTKPGEDLLAVSYSGPNAALGGELVGFFSERLLTRTEEGMERSSRQTAGRMGARTAPQAAGVASPGVASNREPLRVATLGARDLLAQHAVWRPERFPVAVLVFVASLVFMMLVFAFLEWADPSFKSERQVARYLDVPILGSIPNLDNLPQALIKK